MASGPISLDKIITPTWTIIVYGATGTGKTILALSSQSMRTFVFDIDQGAVSANAFLAQRGLRRDLCTIYPVRSKADYYEAWNYFQAHKSSYDLVVVDTATELQRMMLGEICTAAKRVAADQRDWGQILSVMEEISRQFRTLGKHVIWTAHETNRGDETLSLRQAWRPAFQGAFKESYGKHFSGIWRYCLLEQQVQVEGKSQYQLQRWLNCQRDMTTDAKDRSMALNKWEQPDIDAIFSKMNASITAPNTAQGA